MSRAGKTAAGPAQPVEHAADVPWFPRLTCSGTTHFLRTAIAEHWSARKATARGSAFPVGPIPQYSLHSSGPAVVI